MTFLCATLTWSRTELLLPPVDALHPVEVAWTRLGGLYTGDPWEMGAPSQRTAARALV